MSYSSSPVMLAGYPCRILRTSQKSTTLRVDSDGTLRIRTNRRVSNQQLERFVRAHEDWIRQAREKAGTAAQQPLENTIRLLGEPWEIRTGSLCRGEGWLQVPAGEEEVRRRQLVLLVQEIAREKCQQRLAYFAPLLGLAVPPFSIGRSNSQWGCCRKNGALRFSWKILLLGERELDYLVVHELCHLREFNHSARFWALVETLIPDWKTVAQQMKEAALSPAFQVWRPY